MSDRVAVLVCTHDRPQFLQSLLQGLQREWQPGFFLVVVDNGIRSSAPVVESFRKPLDVSYQRLEQPGLVLARNASIAMALARGAGTLVFIDDDEVPQKGWLASLLRRLREGDADLVTGPVVPEFLTRPPAWALRGKYFEDDGHSYRTSNLAIRAAAFPEDPRNWFQSPFNLLGGEDSELLSRLVDGGAVHAVAADAVVTEFIPMERLRRRYLWRRGTRDGAVIAEIVFVRRGASAAAYLLCLGELARKLAYVTNHLFWTWRSPWRINNALYDVHAAAGICLRMAGFRPSFYGGGSMGRACKSTEAEAARPSPAP